MSKEIEKKECDCCESHYRLVYNLDDTSGYPKFCPFCGSEAYDDDKMVSDEDEE
jgi:hypothetical protein